jgi:hypothetical protein
MWMRFDHFLGLRYEKLAIIVQQAVQCLQHFRGGQVKFVEYYPVTLTG